MRNVIDRVVKCCKTQKEWKVKGCKTLKEWKVFNISSIHKNGDRRDTKNYRLFSKMLQKRRQKYCIELVDETQSGGLPGRFGVANLFIIQQLIKNRITHKHGFVWLSLI